MKRALTPYLLPFTLLLPVLFSADAYAKIICWTNNEGIRECGNAVPPEYAQKETRTINERGMTTEINERAKTPEEIAAERARQAEEQRLANEEEKLHKAKENYDRVLLATYLSEEDIIRSRNRQSASLDATIEVSHTIIAKLQEKLDEEQKKASGYEKQGKELPERLQQDITSLQDQIASKNRYIETKQAEKQRLIEKYEAQIIRFRELKANGVKLH